MQLVIKVELETRGLATIKIYSNSADEDNKSQNYL